MAYPTKIATCCYCGTRAALVLGRDRHELTCSSCGAPLHEMKRLRQDPVPTPGRYQDQPKPPRHPRDRRDTRAYLAWSGKPKKRKGLMRYILKEAIDVIEDIFD